MKQSKYPEKWNEKKIRSVIEHYESQTEDEAVEEDEGVLQDPTQTVIVIPTELVQAVREMVANYQKAS